MENKRRKKKQLFAAIIALAAFIVWTVLVRLVDVRPIGPQGSKVGFAAFNAVIHHVIGVNMTLYAVTDWLGLVPVGVVLGFACLGLAQLVRRKSVFKVDKAVLLLGGFYVIVLAAYVIFELVPVNYRPVLINGYLEASYPSSTTLLTLCVMPTAAVVLRKYIKNETLGWVCALITTVFTAFMVVGRLASGVHWFSDIFGGALLSAGLVTVFVYLMNDK